MTITAEIIQSSKPLPSFILPMRKAIREGRKTQTRRVVKPQPRQCNHKAFIEADWKNNPSDFFDAGDGDWICRLCGNVFGHNPYGAIGDIQYLKEPLKECNGDAIYEDTGDPVFKIGTTDVLHWRWKVKLLTKMYMPKEAARLFVRRTITKVERVNEISEADSIAEGLKRDENHPRLWTYGEGTGGGSTNPKYCFEILWDLINESRGHPFSKNEWVWAIGFELLK